MAAAPPSRRPDAAGTANVAFRSLPPWLRDKYFTQQGSEWQPVADLQARVATWSVVNLAAPEEYSAYASSPIIFCRNAFIYFSPTSVKTVVNAFADRMPAPRVSVRRRVRIPVEYHRSVQAR
jgi:chemotaxis methyl-accepting protein methylase